MKVQATQAIEVEVSDKEIGYALMAWALRRYGYAHIDDAGCDWMTDGDTGATFIGSIDWPVSTVPAFAALVDAANEMILGHALKA